MKKSFIAAILFILLLASCAPAKGSCGDGTCEGPETTGNCPQDCSVPLGTGSEPSDSSHASSGDDLARSVEITVTTDTLSNGYGMTVTGVVNFDLDFPAEGGEAELTMGSVTITDYAWEEVPGCEVIIPEGLVGSSQSITYDKIEYYPGGFMILTAPIHYEPVNFEVVMKCTNANDIPLSEMPYYKVFGAINEKLSTLSFKPEESFDNTIKWGTNDAFTSRLIIKVH